MLMIRRHKEIYRPSMSVSLFRAPNSSDHRITAIVNFARDSRTVNVVISMPNDVARSENVDPTGTRAISPRAKLQAALMLNGPRAILRAMLTFHAHVRRDVYPQWNESARGENP